MRYCKTYSREIPDDKVDEVCPYCSAICFYNGTTPEKYPEE